MPDVISGVVTSARLAENPPCFHVDWVAWDSGFRSAGLRPGDRIIASNGVRVIRPEDGTALQRYTQTFLGQLSEDLGFAAAGLGIGASHGLTIRRRAPAKGWQTIECQGSLQAPPNYRLANGRPALAAEGPDTMEYDGFSGNWGGWYETIRARLEAVLARGWQGSFVSQYEAKSLRDDHDARIAALVSRYPGPFAAAMQADYAAALGYAGGAIVDLPPDALEFRRRGEALAGEIRAAATAAWAACQDRVKDSLIPAFPTGHPIRDGMAALAGKHVILPVMGNSDYVADTGRTWFTAGNDSDGWYFIDAEAAPAQAVLVAQQRYRRRVNPDIRASWQFLAKILPEPRLGMVNDQAHYGCQVEPIAALVGDGAMCVDLAANEFAGEAALHTGTVSLLPPDAPPSAVMAALVSAVKEDDIDNWRALFADWWVERLADGRPVIHPHAIRIDDNMFEDSRRSLLGRVLDARSIWEDDPVMVTDGSLFEGALRIEEVTVELDHIGSFDGVTRSFNDVTVRRWWQLQRVNGGPWRVADVQPI